MNPRESIRAFLEEYPPDRYGTTQPSGVGQMLGLGEARLQALALLLKRDPEKVREILDDLVYRTDLGEPALAEARKSLGLLDRKTLPELLEGAEPGPTKWPPGHPGPLPKPIKLKGDGPSASDMILEDREPGGRKE